MRGLQLRMLITLIAPPLLCNDLNIAQAVQAALELKLIPTAEDPGPQKVSEIFKRLEVLPKLPQSVKTNALQEFNCHGPNPNPCLHQWEQEAQESSQTPYRCHNSANIPT